MKKSWHEHWYDTEFAKINIDSVDLHKLAKKEVPFILDVANPTIGSKILDVPCGSGRHSLNFASFEIHLSTFHDERIFCFHSIEQDETLSAATKRRTNDPKLE